MCDVKPVSFAANFAENVHIMQMQKFNLASKLHQVNLTSYIEHINLLTLRHYGSVIFTHITTVTVRETLKREYNANGGKTGGKFQYT